MKSKQRSKLSGYLFVAAGAMFFVASFAGKQPAFSGVGVVFLALGATALRQGAK